MKEQAKETTDREAEGSDGEQEIERYLLETHVKQPVGRKEMIKCSDSMCFMYLSLSLAKINLFISLIGLVLICT